MSKKRLHPTPKAAQMNVTARLSGEMMKPIRLSIFVLSLLCAIQLVVAQDLPQNGQLQNKDDVTQAWDEHLKQWVTPEVFWEQYARTNGGVYWGRAAEYPVYEQVKEHDTILIETGHGPCLMEFFHTRWRRANDVRRWDENFNDYAGCPNVFD